MIQGFGRALRFQKGWAGRGPETREAEISVGYGGGGIPATLVEPVGVRPPLPGWVILHGITRPGRRHPTLLRFVRALAGAGIRVLVPEVREWTELELAPDRAGEILQGAVEALATLEGTAPGGVGAMGFSFGSPQVLVAAARPPRESLLRAVVGFGGYADLERTLHFLFRGEFDWEGETRRLDPDPYGRWVAAGNFLREVPDLKGGAEAAEALLELARVAGDAQVGAWEAYYDQAKGELEGGLDAWGREIFRALAPAAGEVVPAEVTRTLVPALARAARSASPSFDVLDRLQEIRIPVRLVHGRQDRLIPFTESVRLARAFPPGADVRLYLTGLFAHSDQGEPGHYWGEVKEKARFLLMMWELLELV